VAPVGKEVLDYLAQGKGAAPETELLRCQKCNADNEATASFCKICGAPLAKTKPCQKCGKLNDPDARFCDRCGKALA